MSNYLIPAIGGEGDPGFLEWASAMRAAVLDLGLRANALEGNPTFVGAFDEFPGAFRAHALRRCFTSYSGALIRVRRSSDNAEMDVSADDDGHLNTAPMLTWAGSDSVYVPVWYDQSGNNRHLSQSNAAAQPRIVNAGSLEVNAGKPKLVFDGSNDYLFGTHVGLYAAGAATFVSVHGISPDSADTYFGEVGDTSANSYRLARVGAGSSSPLWRASAIGMSNAGFSATGTTGDVTFDGNLRHLFVVDTGTQLTAYQDQIERYPLTAAARPSSTPTLVRTSLGAAGYTTPTGFVTGFVQEIIAWGSNQLSNRADISNASKAYWGTP